MLPLRRLQGEQAATTLHPGRVSAARARQQVVEGEVVARAAILAGEAVAQEHVEAGEGRLRRGLHEGLERDHARQLHLEARAVHRAVVLGDDVHPLEEHRLDGVLPRPQRQRIVAERPEVGVEHQRRPSVWRYVSVHRSVPRADSLGCRRQVRGVVYRQACQKCEAQSWGYGWGRERGGGFRPRRLRKCALASSARLRFNVPSQREPRNGHDRDSHHLRRPDGLVRRPSTPAIRRARRAIRAR